MVDTEEVDDVATASLAVPTIRDIVGAWRADRAHSSVTFTAKHMMVSTVRGAFDDFDATITIDEDPERSSAAAVIRTATIRTNDEDRDAHLRSPDFLDSERYPEMRFTSTSVEDVSVEDRRFTLRGDLTVRDVTRPVTLDVSVDGWRRDADGHVDRIAFVARGELRRKDHGLTWNRVLETGGVLVGDRVGIELAVTAVRADA